MATTRTHGVLFVHSAPPSLCPHLEWATHEILGSEIAWSWETQPVLPGTLKSVVEWRGAPGTGAALASHLRGWEHLRFEVTEHASPGIDGGRWMHTPDLGIFYSQMDAAGNTVVSEDRILSALDMGAGNTFEIGRQVRLALGHAWDEELEPFRRGQQDAPIVWFKRVG